MVSGKWFSNGKWPDGQNPIPEQYQNKPAEDLTRPGPRPGEFSIYLLIVWELLL